MPVQIRVTGSVLSFRSVTVYRAPTRDVEFIYRHVLDVSAICDLPGYEHVDIDTALSILGEAARFMEEVIAPTNRIGDTEPPVLHADGSVTVPRAVRDAYAQYVEAGWTAVTGDASVADPNGNSDGDNDANLIEYATMTSPVECRTGSCEKHCLNSRKATRFAAWSCSRPMRRFHRTIQAMAID